MLALAVLMALAFVPLFFAVASLTRATLRGVREESARALGRTVAAHAAEALASGEKTLLAQRMESDVGQGGVEAIDVFDSSGRSIASAGDPAELATILPPKSPYGEGATPAHGTRGRALDVSMPSGGFAVVARLRTDDVADQGAALVGLVAIYMSTFALALLVFAYFALTRLIVRPIDALVRAADRVVAARAPLAVSGTSARELSDLGSSLQAMTSRLIQDESAMRAKVEELTLTTKRLTDTRAQLARSERLASVGRLAAGIAHEIGNPIAALIGMEDLLLEGDLDPGTQRTFLERMKRETDRIHAILRDLLDFARPEMPASQASGEPSVLAEVIANVLGLARMQRTPRPVDYRTELEAGSLLVALPSHRLTQVLLNLLLNASAAIASSQRAHGSAEAASSITLRAQRDSGKVRIEVEDSGPGIDPAIADRLFEPFVTTKDVGEGTGLGLAVCRGIVEAAGGEIFVDRSFRPGARFVLVLPQA